MRAGTKLCGGGSAHAALKSRRGSFTEPPLCKVYPHHFPLSMPPNFSSLHSRPRMQQHAPALAPPALPPPHGMLPGAWLQVRVGVACSSRLYCPSPADQRHPLPALQRGRCRKVGTVAAAGPPGPPGGSCPGFRRQRRRTCYQPSHCFLARYAAALAAQVAVLLPCQPLRRAPLLRRTSPDLFGKLYCGRCISRMPRASGVGTALNRGGGGGGLAAGTCPHMLLAPPRAVGFTLPSCHKYGLKRGVAILYSRHPKKTEGK